MQAGPPGPAGPPGQEVRDILEACESCMHVQSVLRYVYNSAAVETQCQVFGYFDILQERSFFALGLVRHVATVGHGGGGGGGGHVSHSPLQMFGLTTSCIVQSAIKFFHKSSTQPTGGLSHASLSAPGDVPAMPLLVFAVCTVFSVHSTSTALVVVSVFCLQGSNGAPGHDGAPGAPGSAVSCCQEETRQNVFQPTYLFHVPHSVIAACMQEMH